MDFLCVCLSSVCFSSCSRLGISPLDWRKSFMCFLKGHLIFPVHMHSSLYFILLVPLKSLRSPPGLYFYKNKRWKYYFWFLFLPYGSDLKEAWIKARKKRKTQKQNPWINISKYDSRIQMYEIHSSLQSILFFFSFYIIGSNQIGHCKITWWIIISI